MSEDRLARVGEVLEQALSLEAIARARYLDNACAGDSELRAEVESLIASHERAGSWFLNEPALGGRMRSAAVGHAPVVAGSRVGPYLIVDEIGRGGMGVVFSAVRADGQYEQTVALKIVRAGYATPDVLERFRTERQILAGLEHPNIARLFDGGATGSGAPYLVMELVDGAPIDAFCRARSLSIVERLRLFLQVCTAVQYAHRRLVIHRDIKPGNILVTADGVPKLLDFGIAKMLDPLGSAAETTLRPFTLEYASPEQVRGEPVSTASDVYALGVVLYQLLTGRLPYALDRHTSGELADAITGREPDRPSTAVVARAADSTSPRLERELRGDLDVILLKALRKEPDKRYLSVEQFADDIRRHLDGLPVAARKGTWTYIAGKFARRHWTGVAAAALVLLTLVGGIVVTAREARIAEAQRRRADARFKDVRKLANSLLFEVNDSIQNLPGATDARKLILQRSLEYLDSLAKESGNEPDLVRELATAYDRVGMLQGNSFRQNLGDTKAASISFQKSVSMRESLARANPDSHRDQVELAGAYITYGEFQSGSAGNVRLGFQYEKRALAILDREAQAAPDDERIMRLTRSCLTTLGLMQVGNGLMAIVGTPAEGIADLERVLSLLARAIGRSPADVTLRERQGSVELMIAQALITLGDRGAAFAHFQRGIEILEPIARRGDNALAAFNLAVTYERIGDALLIEGRVAEALPYYLECEGRSSRLAAADPHNESVQKNEVIALVTTGHAMVELGRIEEGLHYIRRALAKSDAASSDTPITRAVEALVRGWFGEALERQGRVREASIQYALTKEKLGALRARGVDDPRMQGFYAVAVDRLGAARIRLGEIDSGTRDYDEARHLLEPLLAAHPADQELGYALADTYTRQGMAAEIRAERARAREDKLSQWRAAQEAFQRSLDVWKRVPHPARTSTSGFEVTVPADVRSRLAQCETKIRSLIGVDPSRSRQGSGKGAR